MCVIGAGKRALRGETAREILAMYYPGLELMPIRDPGSGIGNPSTTARLANPESRANSESRISNPGSPPVVARASGIAVTVPPASTVAAADLERMTARAHDALSKTLGCRSPSVCTTRSTASVSPPIAHGG
jgi:hypothetical protein